jgi:hypothetical protein
MTTNSYAMLPKRFSAYSRRQALGERRHRGLARRLVTVRWRAVFVLAEGKGPRPRRPNRRSVREAHAIAELMESGMTLDAAMRVLARTSFR